VDTNLPGYRLLDATDAANAPGAIARRA